MLGQVRDDSNSFKEKIYSNLNKFTNHKFSTAGNVKPPPVSSSTLAFFCSFFFCHLQEPFFQAICTCYLLGSGGAGQSTESSDTSFLYSWDNRNKRFNFLSVWLSLREDTRP